MPDIDVGSKKMPKWALWALGGIAVVGVAILLFSKRSTAPTSATTTAAAPSGALQTATTGQDLSTLNNNAATEWSGIMTQLQNMSQNTPDYATTIASLTDVTGQQATKLNQLGGQLSSQTSVVNGLKDLITNQTAQFTLLSQQEAALAAQMATNPNAAALASLQQSMTDTQNRISSLRDATYTAVQTIEQGYHAPPGSGGTILTGIAGV